MYSFGFDNVKADKAYAMSRYKRERKLKNILRLFEAFVALAFISWFSNCIHISVKIGSQFFRHVATAFGQHLFVFTLLNVIILFVFVLSDRREPTKPNFYDEYVTEATGSHRRIAVSDYSPAPEVKVEESTETYQDKQIICVDNALSVSPVNQYRVKRTVSSPVRGDAVSTVTKVKTYRRNNSENFEKCGTQRVFRRSETALGREVVGGWAREPARKRCVMDDLSNEEFKLTIESFIAAKKKTLLQENICLQSQEGKEYMSIVPT